MKSLMNLEAFCSLNRPHISKIHENSLDWNLITTARAGTILELKNANKILIKFAPNLISNFETLELFQVTLDQRVLKIVLRSKVENACAFHEFFIGGHVVRARLSAVAMKSNESQ